MLKDAVRTDAYRDFIYENKHLFKDKVVLDIGCGTGILSMFCAKAGAAKVIAVDKSDIIAKARENVFHNGLADQITCLRGAIEEVVLPVSQVDIIVSEWMGYCLLYEAMLPSVLFARDKYLKPDGLLVPSAGSMWIAPVADPEFVSDHITYWRDVYGFDMKAMQEGIYDEVRVEHMPEQSICGTGHPFKMLDLHRISVDDLVFKVNWNSKFLRNVDEIDGFTIWFDMFFGQSREEEAPQADMTIEKWTKQSQGNVGFTTSAFGTATHWKQGLLVAPPQEGAKAAWKASDVMSGEVEFSILEENARALGIEISWSGESQGSHKRPWKLK
jgi:predicted RNA methylase